MAARYLSRFDALSALRLIGRRDDAGALALRGVAMAQLGEDHVAQKLLSHAERELPRDSPLRARVLAARGEVALATRELALADRLLAAAEAALARDRVNAVFVRLLRARLLLLLGRVEEARALPALDLRGAPPRLRAQAQLLRADIAARSLRVLDAQAAIAQARLAGRAAALPPLSAQIERVAAAIRAPVARLVRDGRTVHATLREMAALARDPALVIDACRQELRRRDDAVVSLRTRPTLFALARTLGEAAPLGQTRAFLIERAFAARRTSDSLRARLRVEIGRLRRVLAPLRVAIEPTPEGFALRAERVVVVLPPAEGESSLLLALLRGGEAWSSSALASASGLGKRVVQRALAELQRQGKVTPHGAGRSRRWVAPPPEGFATTLLLGQNGARRSS